MNGKFEKTEISTIHRQPVRGSYDHETIYKIVDEAPVCHIGFVVNNQPFVIPTLHGRMNDKIVFHGAVGSRLIEHITAGNPVCLTCTVLDALVLAKSIFHHSMNYRSVVAFGTGGIIDDPVEKLQALKAISDHLLPGRWSEVREPNEKELGATSVAYINIDTASAKTRSGPPVEDKADADLEHWSGILPLAFGYAKEIPADEYSANSGLPESLKRVLR